MIIYPRVLIEPIVIKGDNNRLGYGGYKYHWQGEPRQLNYVSRWIVAGGHAPWELEIIEKSFMLDSYLCRRKDARWSLVSKYVHLIRRTWERFTHRVIYTLDIWGLAYVQIGNEPRWSDIGKKRRSPFS